MDEAEKAILAEANAAANGGAPPVQPPQEEKDQPSVAGGDAMELEEEPEVEHMRIVRDYKRQDAR